ncbi:MAG: metalloregulator ArsR/SmtB family transcription factor [Hoeflea sp.]|nr:metalloregulator ArsR/SmtB family transcription factor [Hoeflea sp.]
MDDIFQALSDGTRRAMLRHLAKGELTIGELSEPFPMSLAAASKHIRVLEKAGLIRREIRWRTHICHLEAAPLKQAVKELAFYERFWISRLDTLERLLREDHAEPVRPSAFKPSEGDEG